MTTPMESLPHKIVRCTRDTRDGLPLFLPDEKVTQILKYALGVTLEQYRDELYALGGGYDATREVLVLYDLTGCLSDFFERLHHRIALALKKELGLPGSVFKPHQQFTRQYLETADDILDALAEVRAMPVREGRVKRARHYPGLILDDEPERVARPDVFPPHLPDEVTLHLHRPPGFEALAKPAWQTMLRARVRALEREYRSARRAKNQGFLGVARLAALSPLEPLGTEHRPDYVPRESVRAHHDPLRGTRVARRLRRFKPRYRARWLRFAKGEHHVVFPPGTFQLTRYAGAKAGDGQAAARRCAYPVRGGPRCPT